MRGLCDAETAEQLNRGRPPVHEPALPAIIRRNVRAGRLTYGSDPAQAVAGVDFVYISPDTPVDGSDRANLGPVYELAEQIAPHLGGRVVLCVTAQVPVGTTEALGGLVERIAARRCEAVYVPEFLRLGVAVATFRRPDRVVIGARSKSVGDRVAALYEPLGRPIVLTDVRSAEMAKHASNAFLATAISFGNEIGELCEALGADATEVTRILQLDRRIGRHVPLRPGLGFAGGTLGRELRALQDLGKRLGASTPLVDAVWRVNASRVPAVVHRLELELGALSGRRIAVLGLTYKPGTSTLRRSPALEIVRRLVRGKADVAAYDPLADLSELRRPPAISLLRDPIEAVRDSDAVLLVTPWEGIEQLSMKRLRRAMRGDLFFDPGNLLDADAMTEIGFRYLTIGRPSRSRG